MPVPLHKKAFDKLLWIATSLCHLQPRAGPHIFPWPTAMLTFSVLVAS